jgi:hypothetical protein
MDIEYTDAKKLGSNPARSFVGVDAPLSYDHCTTGCEFLHACYFFLSGATSS